MPRYELMYILASSVSDDIVPETTKQIEQFVQDFEGANLTHELLGKKKLAYAIKKTRNGHYGVINFEMPSTKINLLDAKLRTQKNTVIRYIIINLEEHLLRTGKDQTAQVKLNKNRSPEEVAKSEAANETTGKPISSEQIDQEIEKALSEDLL